MVSTMVNLGYLYQPVPRGGYYPTTRWMELARDLSESQPIPESVHELLVELAKQTGETLFLAAPEGTSVVFLDVVESSADIRFIANVGQRLPIHVTAAGRAILSRYSPAERAAVLKRIKYQPYEKDTFMTPDSVERNIQKSSKNGWFVNPGIYAPGVGGIAVPFPFRGRRNAIALGGPVARIEKRVDAIGKLLRESVDRFLEENA
jgi:IclR family transcriptional regulator, acetate operon repressor